MTFIHPLDVDSPSPPRLPRLLDAVETRVLGSLMEKQLATPEYYPLTLNALVAACNQKSNREPVMELGDSDVEAALGGLQDEKLVWRVVGGRAVRFDHNLDAAWHLNREEKALLALLFLRGAQTAGELRGRSDRLQPFDSVMIVEERLVEMSTHSDPLVRELPRRPGQKEGRWMHTVSGVQASGPEREPSLVSQPPLAARVQQLEDQVATLASELQALKQKLGE